MQTIRGIITMKSCNVQMHHAMCELLL